ncbi:hypothetical protein EST38_g11638 [Candolleomyces aberdarensis]|uniref:Uncharacterized protein n=1 Tax=Candolleomyces aberdarensis TaxID=2316362 RepID=A0A4Q2D4C9_9AGAR|nr:hypothetical protein EST38_g11638 [Candolleomyces aberdarensis]
MDPPKRPRRRNELKEFVKHPVNFLKERFGSRTPSPSRSRPASRSNIAGDTGTSSKPSLDVPIGNPPTDDTNRGEIQRHQDNIDKAIGGPPRQDLSSQAIQSTGSEAIPPLPAQTEENSFMPPTSTFDHSGTSQFSDPGPFPPIERLERPRGEEEAQGITAHVDNLIQAHGATVVEGGLSDLSSPTESNVPATEISLPENDAQDNNAQVERQPAGLASKIYEGVKTTLRKVVEVSDVFPPLKSVAAGLLVICDTIDVSPSSEETTPSVSIYD